LHHLHASEDAERSGNFNRVINRGAMLQRLECGHQTAFQRATTVGYADAWASSLVDSAKTLKKRPYSLFLGLCGEGSVLGRIGERTPGMTAYSGSERNNIVHEQNAYSQNDPDLRHSRYGLVVLVNRSLPDYNSQGRHFKITSRIPLQTRAYGWIVASPLPFTAF
jgi:hypothetical protein